MEKPKKDRKKTTRKDTPLDMKAILEFGGNKKDLELIGDLDDDEDEVMDYADDMESAPVKRDEIESLIDQLGFREIFMENEAESGDEDQTIDLPEKTQTKKNKQQREENLPDTSSQEKKKEKKKKNKYKIQVEEISSTTEVYFTKDYQPRKYLLIKPGLKWFDYAVDNDPAPTGRISDTEVKKILDYVTKLYNNEVSIYKSQQENSKKSDTTWIKTVLATGTLSDKMAAMTLLIQETPIHNLNALDQLILFVKKKGRREALMATDSLKELFMSELLLDSRKLKSFEQHPLLEVEALSSGNKDSRDKRLLVWFYESQLRSKYEQFVEALENMCHDNITTTKQKALGVVMELLSGKPEQEKRLLAILSNKLGDPDHKVASKASFLLTKLVERHPNMRSVIVQDVERLMYRPNVASKAQYYAVCFLNQIVFSEKEAELALKLINIYFSFFKAYVKKGEVDSKMLSALLTGVNRAYPFAKVDEVKITEQMNTLYKIVHIVNFNTSIQALMLLYQVMDSSESTSDRYYQALYSKIIDPGLLHSSKQPLFLNLLYKSLKRDSVDRRVKAFIKRLLQVCCVTPPSFICGALVLLSEVMKTKPSLFQFTQLSQDMDEDDEHFADIKLEDDSDGNETGSTSENPAESSDDSDLEVEEDDNSATDGSSDGETPHVNDKFVMDRKPDIKSLVQKQEMDVLTAAGHHGYTTTPSWVHRRNITDKKTSDLYDPQGRNPLYVRAESECLWELKKLADHFHPTVALFSSNILKGDPIQYPGDPLEDFTLIRFLDRFVFRNPKKKQKETKAVGEKKSVHEHFQSRNRRTVATGAKGFAINSEEYLKTAAADIPVDEKFFFKYFTRKAALKKMKEDRDSDVESVDDDEFDDFLDKYEQDFDGADLDLDFAGEFSKDKKSKKADNSDESDDGDLDNDLDDDLSEEEVDFGDDMMVALGDEDDADFESNSEDESEGGGDEIDEENIAFSDDDELMNQDFSKESQKKRKTASDEDDFFVDGGPSLKKKHKRVKETDAANLFAAAEEFSHLIDENTSSKLSTTGTEAMSNKDNADVKQLKWEQNRERWVDGRDWKSRKRGGPRGGGGQRSGGGQRGEGGHRGRGGQRGGGGHRGRGGHRGGGGQMGGGQRGTGGPRDKKFGGKSAKGGFGGKSAKGGKSSKKGGKRR